MHCPPAGRQRLQHPHAPTSAGLHIFAGYIGTSRRTAATPSSSNTCVSSCTGSESESDRDETTLSSSSLRLLLAVQLDCAVTAITHITSMSIANVRSDMDLCCWNTKQMLYDFYRIASCRQCKSDAKKSADVIVVRCCNDAALDVDDQ